jgi:Leucine-rich repeat (LRR) protein
MKIYYKTSKFSIAHCCHSIEIGKYDKILSDKYNKIYWEYIKNGNVPSKFDEDGKNELPEYKKLHLSIRLLINEIIKIDTWKKQMNREISDGLRKKRTGRPPITQLPIQFETINEMISSNLYKDIVEINFMNNSLTELPIIPPNLKILICYNNSLTKIGPLPITLTHLNISNNKLKAIPELPPNLEYLNCSNNNISYIGTLPISLNTLICHNNNLKYFPNMASRQECTRGSCYGDYFFIKNTVPCLHYKLSYVMIDNNPIESLPKSFKYCLKCNGQNIKLAEYKDNMVVCNDCCRTITILLNNTPLKEYGGIKYHLTDDMSSNMDIDGHIDYSGDEEGEPISYDKIN